jgi:DUF4097 and DUF4098 domain-containing protein YvlB
VENASKEQAQEIFNDLGIDAKPDANGLSITAYFKTGWEPDDRGWGHHRTCMSSDHLHSRVNSNETYCLKYADQLREVRYTLTVPRKVNLDVDTRAGHITIADIDGPVTATTAGGHISGGHVGGVAKIQTAGGHIQLTDSTGPATLKTAGGHITIGDVGGDLIAETAGGHINTGHVHGAVKARTAGGHIEIKQADGAIEAKTVGGSIQARIAAQPKSASYLETSAGSVTLEIANNVKLDVDAESMGGGVYSDFPLQSESASSDDEPSWARNRTLRGRVNGGGPKVEVRTSHGRIKLTKASFDF